MECSKITLEVEFQPFLSETAVQDATELLVNDVASYLLTCGQNGDAWGYGRAEVYSVRAV